MSDQTRKEKRRDDVRDVDRYRWLRQRLRIRYLPYNAGLPFHPFSLRLGDEFQEDDPDPEDAWRNLEMFNRECAKIDAAIDSRLPDYDDEARWIVEAKSRGFDVVDTAITPREDGFYCFCVDQDMAELIARLLNRQDLRVP